MLPLNCTILLGRVRGALQVLNPVAVQKWKEVLVDKLCPIISPQNLYLGLKLIKSHVYETREGGSDLCLVLQQVDPGSTAEVINKCQHVISPSQRGL